MAALARPCTALEVASVLHPAYPVPRVVLDAVGFQVESIGDALGDGKYELV